MVHFRGSRNFEEYTALLFQLLGGAADVALTATDRYLWIIKGPALKWSLVGSAVAVVSALLAETTGIRVFSSFFVLCISMIAAGWLVLLIPVLVVADKVSGLAPVRRYLAPAGFVVIGGLVGAILALRFDAGFSGLLVLAFLFVVAILVRRSGLMISSRFLLVQLVVVLGISILGMYFPASFGVAGNLASSSDRWIARNLNPKAVELAMSEDILTGNTELDPPLFNSFDGSPNWWCRTDTDTVSGFRCFSQPGMDQTTQEELLPITPAIIDASVTNLVTVRLAEEARRTEEAAAEKRRQDEELRRRQAEAEREARERMQAEVQAYKDKYLSFALPAQIGVAVQSDGTFGSQAVRSALTKLSLPAEPMLKDVAIPDGIFQRLKNGDASELNDLALSETYDVLVLGELTDHVQNANVTSLSRRIDMSLELVFINAKDGRRLSEFTITSSQVGQNEEIARERTVADFNNKLMLKRNEISGLVSSF